MRSIDADALKEALEPYRYVDMHFEGLLALIDAADTIPQITVFTESTDEKAIADLKAELQSVLNSDSRPKGEWLDTGDMQEYWAEEYQCSICGAKDHWHNFCPNCGADMRGGTE